MPLGTGVPSRSAQELCFSCQKHAVIDPGLKQLKSKAAGLNMEPDGEVAQCWHGLSQLMKPAAQCKQVKRQDDADLIDVLLSSEAFDKVIVVFKCSLWRLEDLVANLHGLVLRLADTGWCCCTCSQAERWRSGSFSIGKEVPSRHHVNRTSGFWLRSFGCFGLTASSRS